MIIEQYIPGEKETGEFNPVLLRHHPEFLNPPSAVLRDIDIALGVDCDAVRLVELAREMAGTAEARKNFPAFALDDFDLRVVLVDKEDQPLARIWREIEGHRDAAALARFSIRRGFPSVTGVYGFQGILMFLMKVPILS